MDSIDVIDPLSFAAAPAHAAAASFFGLLERDDGAPDPDWPGPHYLQPGALVERLAGFLAAEKVDNPETLWRWAIGERLVRREARQWDDLPFARREAYGLFVRVFATAHAAIADAQARAEQARQTAAAAARIPPLRREDSIFEDQPGLGEQIFTPEQMKAFAAFDHDGDGKPGGSKPRPPKPASPAAEAPPAPPAKPKARSAGQTPARPPVNRGGRGNVKPPRDRKQTK